MWERRCHRGAESGQGWWVQSVGVEGKTMGALGVEGKTMGALGMEWKTTGVLGVDPGWMLGLMCVGCEAELLQGVWRG